ncbi:Hypothetical predicted protein, partial [Pelobates cultripes]
TSAGWADRDTLWGRPTRHSRHPPKLYVNQQQGTGGLNHPTSDCKSSDTASPNNSQKPQTTVITLETNGNPAAGRRRTPAAIHTPTNTPRVGDGPPPNYPHSLERHHCRAKGRPRRGDMHVGLTLWTPQLRHKRRAQQGIGRVQTKNNDTTRDLTRTGRHHRVTRQTNRRPQIPSTHNSTQSGAGQDPTS